MRRWPIPDLDAALNKKATWLWLRIGAIALSTLLFYLFQRFPERLDGFGPLDLTRWVLILLLVGASLVLHRRRSSIAIYPNLGCSRGVVAAQFQLSIRTRKHRRPNDGQVDPLKWAELRPNRSVPSKRRGHFIIAANVAGMRIRFLVDTSTSDIVLTPFEAARLGVDLDGLTFNKTYRTANGVCSAPLT